MSVLCDWQIREEVRIEPYADQRLRPGVISYGESSAGYDLRLGRKFKVATDAAGATLIDPKRADPRAFVDREPEDGLFLMPPYGFCLAESVEYLEIPRGIICVCTGKSTYARVGVIVHITPIEPEWKGKLTLEITNTNPLPAVLYCGEGICQVLFLKLDGRCEKSYADKRPGGGKYQDQLGLTLPISE